MHKQTQRPKRRTAIAATPQIPHGRSKKATTRFTYREQFGVIVLCTDEAEHQRVFNRLKRQGYTCRLVAV